MANLKAILFDIGGTIFLPSTTCDNDKNLLGTNVINYLKQNNININDSTQNFVNNWKLGMKEYKLYCRKNNNLDIVNPDELLTKFVLKKYMKEINKNRDIFRIIANNIIDIAKESREVIVTKQTYKTIKKLSKKYKLGIISNTDSSSCVLLRLARFNILKFFDKKNCIFLSCVSQTRKPNKNIFIAAANSLGIKPNECIYVGNTITRDVVGAKNANYINCIRIRDKDDESCDPILAKQDTKYVIDKFEQIPMCIKDILAK